MNAYPPPSPPALGAATYQYPADPLAPARRAGVLLWALAGITVLVGGCVGVVALSLPSLRNVPEASAAIARLEAQMRPVSIRGLLMTAGVALVVVAIAYSALGFFVRRGGPGAIISSIIVVSLALIYLLVSVLGSLLASDVGGGCLGGVALALHVLLVTWLIQAARRVPAVRAARAQYLAYYSQYQQSPSTFYGYPPPTHGYGYPTQSPPPSAPPQASPGDLPTDADGRGDDREV